MTKEQSVELMTDKMAKFVAYVGKKLPDDVEAKLQELRQQETTPLATAIYDTMARNQKLAVDLNRPCCQDTGVLQFWVKCGVNFPLMGELEALLKEAVVRATFAAPLRHNSVETFDEVNTKRNVGKGTPTVFWDIVPDDDHCEIYTYMAGGGCTLPGKAMVLMPGMGYEGVTKFVLDQMTSYGLNACPPLLVGVGVATSVETAALLSKKALMRPLGSHNPNPRAAEMEKLLEEGDYTRREKSQKNITGPVSVIYWLVATAIFMIYTFGPKGNGQPRYSWIIWAVAGVLYAAVLAGIKLIRNRK